MFTQRTKWDIPTKEHSGRVSSDRYSNGELIMDAVLIVLGIVIGGIIF